MRPLFLTVAALTLGASVACAQTSQQVVVAPVDRSTGPTVPDTRIQDQNTAIAPSTSDGTANPNGNWRTSSGLNSNPDNPDGTPGPSTISNSNRITR